MEGSYDFFNSTNSSSLSDEASSSTTNDSYRNEIFWYRDDFHFQNDEPIRDPLYIVIPITVIYATIFITGIVGNVSTCVVIARNKSMHTATNYYLFSLAVSDLLLLVLGMPVEIYQVWYKYPYIFGETFCIIRGLAAETSTNASVLTITAFTIERYVAICHPFLSQTMSKLSRVVKLILSIWLIALLSAIPQVTQFGLVVKDGDPDKVVCSIKRIIFQDSFILASIVFFVVPLLLISVLYLLIGCKLNSTTANKECRKHKCTLNTRVKVGSTRMDKHCRQHHLKSTKRVIKMLVAVVVTFFVCWAPFHIQRLIATNSEDSHSQTMEYNARQILFYNISTYISGILYYFSTTINPILYSIMSNKFREAFMETLGRSCRLSRFMRSYRRSYSSLSRSQQRNPVAFPTKTTGISLGAPLAQESTDCSGNSIRDEFHQVDFSDSPPSAICNGNGQESSHKDVISIEMGSCSMNLSSVSLSRTQLMNKSSGSRSPREFVESFRQHQLKGERELHCSMGKELSTVERDKSFVLNSSSAKQSNLCNVNYQTKPIESSKKKWWRLFNWLPGLENIRASRSMIRSNQDIVAVDLDRRQQQPQQPKDYYLQLHTFKVKDEPCRPV